MTSQDNGEQKARGTSFLYALLEKARQYDDLIAMGRGDPDLDTPAHILEALSASLRRTETERPNIYGLSSLRRSISERVRSVNGIEVDPDQEVLVTNGAQEAVYIAILTLAEPQSDILVPVPAYNSYRNVIAQTQARLVAIPTAMQDAFEVSEEAARAAITPESRCIILNSPNNPSAAVLSPPVVERLVEFSAERDLRILADDIYDRFLYDGAQHLSPSSLPEGRDRTLTVNGVSKAYSMTGWRMGWIVGPTPLIRRAAELKAGISGPTSLVAQHAGLAALNGPQDCVDEAHQTYIRRRTLVLEKLDQLGFTYGRPKGGQFVFVNIGSTGLDGWEFAQRTLEQAHVLVYPGGAFGDEWRSFIRITFLQPEEVLRMGLDRIGEVVIGL